MKTDNLINALSQDTAVQWRFDRVLAWATFAGIAVAGAAFFSTVGFRHDISDAVETVRFLFKFVVTLSLAIAARGLILHIARPGDPTGLWSRALLLAPLLLVAAVLFELAVTSQDTWGTRLIGTNARHCLTLIPLFAIGPLACLILALRQGAPARPGLAGAIAGLAASGIAATFYAANCTDDSPLFVAVWYPLATGIVVLAGYLAGRRFLSW